MLQFYFWALEEANYHTEAERVAERIETLYGKTVYATSSDDIAEGRIIAEEFDFDGQRIGMAFLVTFHAVEFTIGAAVAEATLETM